MRILGIIPSRYASTRLPGKPLLEIGGMPMIARVAEQTLKARGLFNAVVATDDERIRECVEAFGMTAVMTDASHASGTERCAEAMEKIENDFDAVINIQGDEPLVHPEQIEAVATMLHDGASIATLIKRIVSSDELFNSSVVKAVVNQNFEAIYFSRQPIPYNLSKPHEHWLSETTYYKHVGIYGYTVDTLKFITGLKPTMLERAESLEQLRWLEHRLTIQTAVTEHDSIGIDTPEDLQRANERFTTR